MMEFLNVFLHNRKVGTLQQDKGHLQFSYDEDYVTSPLAEPLSYRLPIRREPYADLPLSAFFSNLLPDEGIRVRIAEILGLSPENTFALLKEIGEDCAGAIAFYTPDKTPLAPGNPSYRSLSDQEAASILEHLPERPLNIGAQDFRISGAGAQDKLIACLKQNKLLLPLNGTPSTHIIKPGIERFPESVYNEFFCMKLATQCGIPAAKCDIITINNIPYYVTQRYDRQLKDGICLRLHQEDFCQLLGYAPTVKYEAEGGPGLLQCFELIRSMELQANDTIAFFKQVIFNFIIGNGDAHAKNFSVIYVNHKPQLAPAYDLLSTTVYPQLAPRMAMKIDGEYNFRWITPGKILRLTKKAGLSETIVKKCLADIKLKLDKQQSPLLQTSMTAHPAGIYHKIAQGIRQRLQQLAMP